MVTLIIIMALIMNVKVHLMMYCDPDYVLAMFQDLNNVVCLVWISLGLQGFSSLHVFLW